MRKNNFSPQFPTQETNSNKQSYRGEDVDRPVGIRRQRFAGAACREQNRVAQHRRLSGRALCLALTRKFGKPVHHQAGVGAGNIEEAEAATKRVRRWSIFVVFVFFFEENTKIDEVKQF